MKLQIAALAFLLTTRVFAQEPPPSENLPFTFAFPAPGRTEGVSIDVREAASGAVSSRQIPGGGSFRVKSKTIEVNLRNLSRSPLEAGTFIDVLGFSGKQAALQVSYRKVLPISLGASAQQKLNFELDADNLIFAGWAVLIRKGEYVSSLKASSATIDQFLRSGERFTTSLLYRAKVQQFEEARSKLVEVAR